MLFSPRPEIIFLSSETLVRSESKLNQEDHVIGETITETMNTNIKFWTHLLLDLLEEYSRLVYSL